MKINEIIERHLSSYDQIELDSLVKSGRTTYKELASVIKKDMERKFQRELIALSKGIKMKDYCAEFLLIEGKILSQISKD